MIHNITDKERALSAEVQQLKEELLEQAIIVGMSTDREYALAGKIARQEKVLKLALEWIEAQPNPRMLGALKAITAIREVLAKQPAQQEQHQAWCASLTQMLTSMPPKPAPCNCKQQEPVAVGSARCPRCWEPITPPASKPLTDELNQIEKDLRFHGLTLVKTVTGYAVLKLGQITAHGIKEST